VCLPKKSDDDDDDDDDENDGFKFKSENLCPWDPHWDFLQVQKRYTNIRRTYEHIRKRIFFSFLDYLKV